MSEFDRNKGFQKKKFFTAQRDGANYASRSFSKTNYNKYDRESKDAEKGGEAKEKTVQQPTILIKAREPNPERSASPKRTVKENETPNPIISETSNVSGSLPIMIKPVKLIDEGCFTSDHIQEYLMDGQSDFVVVGIVGGQGVGKSTILNLLAQNKLSRNIVSTIFNSVTQPKQSPPDADEAVKVLGDNLVSLNLEDSEECSETKPSSRYNPIIFKPQSLYRIETANYGTRGINMFVTSNRVIYLDCQPILSCAVLDNSVDLESKRSLPGEYLPVENSAEIYGLQLTSFLLSVCHVILLVQDWFFDSNVIRFIQTAEMLKPSLPTTEEDYIEHFPHVLLIDNKATLQDFTISRFKTAQMIYKEMFSKSKLRLESGMGMGMGNIVKNLNQSTCGDPINLFVLPEYGDDNSKYTGHPTIEELIEALRIQIHGVTKHPLTHVQLSEKTWLLFASKVWDNVKKSSFFLEYSKLMP